MKAAEPVRTLYLQALARRMEGQPEAVRRLLEARRTALAAEPPAAAAPTSAPPASQGASLAQLTAHLRDARAAAAEPLAPGESHDPELLASVRRFRRAWDRGQALDRLADAAARRPANAGPLNSHMLVLRSLDLMRALSPDYLRRFLVQLEALQWLDDAMARTPREPAKATGKKSRPARRSR